MKIEWINHASFVTEVDGITLICDPWIEGRVFNSSWAHLAATKFSYSDFSKITHIWFSHEHPDHFFPPNLKKIPEHLREKITVLYQKSKDGKVVEFCRQLGFQIKELEPLCEYRLNEFVTVINDKVANDSDSWLFLKSSTGNFLNLNDCVFNNTSDLEKIYAITGEIDVLFTQFSYANWVGNKEDIASKNKFAEDKLREIKRNISVFKPTYTIPFASYVWFCSEANFHMNFNINKIDTVYRFINTHDTQALVFYPGDVWDLHAEFDSSSAIEKYLSDFDSHVEQKDFTQFEQISFDGLKISAENYRNRHLKRNNRNKLKSYPPFSAFITDWNETIRFSYRDGLKREQGISATQADISFSSQNMKYCFDFDWGWSTIMVAGTFEKPSFGDFKRIEEYQWISTLNNIGKRMNGLAVRILLRLKHLCSKNSV
jgi:UDP-MurNAc hydroxylase